MKVLSVLLLAALVGIALSVCPNGCSGHGSCNAYDECTCQDEGKSTYFGFMYDTAKGYNRIKQDAMRTMSTESRTTTDVDSSTYGLKDNIQLTAAENGRFLAKEAYVQKQYTGADCSLMTCPRGVSWSRPFSFKGDKFFETQEDPICGKWTHGPTPNEAEQRTAYGCVAAESGSAALHHKPSVSMCRHADFAECSDAGMCDRSSGKCECFEGYEGAACQRTTCPNGCSGHGQCQSNVEFSKDGSLKRVYTSETTEFAMSESAFQVDPRKHYIGAWDSGINFGCKCDIGFRGEDCSMAECPSSKDPQGWYGNDDGEDCSGRGLCSYATGECECFSGYTGTDCGTIEALA